MKVPSVAAPMLALLAKVLGSPVDLETLGGEPEGRLMINTPDWTVTQLHELQTRSGVDILYHGPKNAPPCTFQPFFDTRCQVPRYEAQRYAAEACFDNSDCHSFRITGLCNATLINPHQDRDHCAAFGHQKENADEWSWLPTGYCYHVNTHKNWKSTGVACRRDGHYDDDNKWIVWNGPPGVDLPDMNRPDYQHQCYYSR